MLSRIFNDTAASLAVLVLLAVALCGLTAWRLNRYHAAQVARIMEEGSADA